MIRRWLFYLLAATISLTSVTILVVLLAAFLLYQRIPPLDTLMDYRPAIPLRIYTADGTLIGEFGEERRNLVALSDLPKKLVLAILAAEDEHFYQHHGIDYAGVARAAIANLGAGGAKEGASTITMQVARNFYLSPEKTVLRKLAEAVLTFKIEQNLTKDQILTLYVNQIYLGERAYGFAAAAEVYFGVPMGQLSLAQMAVMAGLPKAPSRSNPLVNPSRAKERQQYVLRRMRELKYISDAEYETASSEPLTVRQRGVRYAVQADYVAEMVRQEVYERYGDDAYRLGLNAFTTVHDDDQTAAERALAQGLLDYDRRHGYRGPEDSIGLSNDATENARQIEKRLQTLGQPHGLIPAVVVKNSAAAIVAEAKSKGEITLTKEGLALARSVGANEASISRLLPPGSIIRVQEGSQGRWTLAQMPRAQAALVSARPQDGAILALAGGFDFEHNRFNHATQALRQPGSSFKPFVYSAALERGFTAATLVNDAPTEFVIPGSNGKKYTPENYDGRYLGRITVRTALARSRNIASVQILNAIGIPYARDYIERFGFSEDQIPPYLTMVLGVGSVTPLQMASAYAVFANGGYRVKPYLIEKVVDGKGNILTSASPAVAGGSAPRIIDERNAFIMTSLMREVIQTGTGVMARSLGRHDLAGKTGSTNDYVDAWFAGFAPSNVTVAWIGYDTPRSLGRGEVGGRAALPMWIRFMTTALKGAPDTGSAPPAGVVAVENGQAGDSNLRHQEFFYEETVPSADALRETEPPVPELGEPRD